MVDETAEFETALLKLLADFLPDQSTGAALDRMVELTFPGIVEPLPGDCFGYFREESDDSLRNRISEQLRKKTR